ncbi:hypothetical protein R3P38DRAFT_3004016 [Favolaschia claudopus]|uniref:F-box domain-containing protein n=1 Tax=Favolaschia claudopus TaxID=2862362 RepID=A0AAW0AKU3_9AGAR
MRCDVELQAAQCGTEPDRMLSGSVALSAHTPQFHSAFVLATVHRLPNEILIFIFDLCCPEESRNSGEEVDNVSQKHLRELGKVCSLWYWCIMGTPSLWCRVEINTEFWDSVPLSTKTLLSLVEFALQKGGTHPLDVRLTVWSAEFRPAMEMLVEHISRWRQVHFTGNSVVSQYLAGVKGKVDQLTSLRLEGNQWKSVEIFKHAVQLSKVELYGRVDEIPELPWTQLREFRFQNRGARGANDCLALLSQAANLDSASFALRLNSRSFDTPWKSSSSRITLFKLRLAARQAELVGCLFDCLTLPALKALDISDHDGLSPPLWAPPQFAAFAARSSLRDHLTELSLHAQITDLELLRCLETLPSLTSLHVSDSDEHTTITDTLLNGLICSFDAAPLIPRLVCLEFTTVLAFTASVYNEVITSRVVARRPRNESDRFTAILRWREPANHEDIFTMLVRLTALKVEGGLLFYLYPGN